MLDPPLAALFLSGAQTQEARKPPALVPAKSDDAKQTADVSAGFRNGSNLNIVDKGMIRSAGIRGATETEFEIQRGLVVNRSNGISACIEAVCKITRVRLYIGDRFEG